LVPAVIEIADSVNGVANWLDPLETRLEALDSTIASWRGSQQ
jgi:hypothetical protein